MNEKQLSIVIGVINNAAGQLAEVGTQLSALGDDATAAAQQMQGSLTAAEQSIIDGAIASASEWSGAADDMVASVAGAASAIEDEYQGMGNSAELAASAASSAWKASLDELEGMMATATTEGEAEFGALATKGEESLSQLQSSISSLGGKLQGAGFQALLGGALITGGVGSLVETAGNVDDAFDQLSNTVTNAYSSAGSASTALATPIADLKAKIDSQEASIAGANAELQKWTGTTAQVAASHEKANATIETATINIQKLQQQLDQLTSSQGLVGGSAASTTGQLEAAAKASTNLGFNVADSANALQLLFASTGNVNDTMAAYQDAMDVARAKHIDLATASNLVIQAMSGQGRGLRDLGIQVSDGLSGQTALAAIQDKVQGSAQKAATEGIGPLNVAMANLNQSAGDAGNTLIPVLTRLAGDLDKVISSVDTFVQKHPEATKVMLEFAGAIGILLVVLGPFFIIFGTIVNFIEIFNTLKEFAALEALRTGFKAVFTILTESVLPALATFFTVTIPEMVSAIFTEIIPALAAWAIETLVAVGPYILIGIAIAALVVLVVLYHKQIMDAISAAWNWVIDKVSNAMLAIYNWIEKELKNVEKLWTDIWNGLVSFMGSIWDDIGKDVQKGISFVEGIISGFAATIQNIYKTIMAPINAITGAVSSVAGTVGNVVGGAIHAFASGGIVNGPTLALVGEAGPEAIIPLSAFAGGTSLASAGGGFGGANINVYIQGGNYLDSNGATMIANALARQIQTQIRLKSYV